MEQSIVKMAWSWAHVSKSTVKLTALATLAALTLAYLFLLFKVPPLVTVGLLTVVIGAPLFFLFAMQRHAEKVLRRQMNDAATYDLATGAYNAPAFMSEIDRRAKDLNGPRRGALLIIDAAHARSLHQRLGSLIDEEPVRIIASAIRDTVRHDDLVGRLDLYTFAVFLPTATEIDAVEIGARIRAAVGKVYVAPDGTGDALSITIGGVICEGTTDFDTMLKAVAEVIETSPKLVKEGVALSSLRS